MVLVGGGSFLLVLLHLFDAKGNHFLFGLCSDRQIYMDPRKSNKYRIVYKQRLTIMPALVA